MGFAILGQKQYPSAFIHYWASVRAEVFNVAFCSYLHLQYFNWAAVPGGRFSNSPTSQSPIVMHHVRFAVQHWADTASQQ
jgi:hypothetical protein